MERYFILDKFNTFADWGFIVTGKSVTPPEPKTKYIELDGANGTLDLSEALTGEITYKDRSVTASFWTSEGSRADRSRLLQKVISAIHGKKIKIVEPDDLDHYFVGRVMVKSTNNILPYAEMTMEADCEPWRYSIEESERKIEVMHQSVNAVIENNGVKTLCPTITVSGDIGIEFDGVTTLLSTGTYRLLNVKLRQGTNIIGVSGYGSVTFTYREATL